VQVGGYEFAPDAANLFQKGSEVTIDVFSKS
jgi:hypothetical protein